MHAAVPPHYDDDGGGSVWDHADRARLWRGRGCAPAARSGGGGRISGLTVADLVHHACDLSVYGNFSRLAARQRGATGSAGSCRPSLIQRPGMDRFLGDKIYYPWVLSNVGYRFRARESTPSVHQI